MRLRRESTPELVDQAGSVVAGGAASVHDIARRLAPSCARAEPRPRVMAYGRGLLSPAERQHSWPLADVSGDTTPEAVQHRLRRARWDPEAVREELRTDIVQPLADPNAVLVIDATGLLTTGRPSAGVARQDSGTAGQVDHGQMGVFLGDARPLGHALRDRERSLPTAWTQDRDRCRRAGLPEDRGLATMPQRAQPRLARAVTAGVPAPGVTGDRVDDAERRWRRGLEAQPQADVLAVSGQAYVWLGWRPRQVNTILAALPENGWTRLSAGDGTKGPRWDDWRGRSVAAPREPGWRRWWRVRRRLGTPTELTADVVFARDETTLDAVVRVAGTRWTIESGFEAAQREVGLDHDEVRSWTGWSRHLTLARWALARLTVLRARAIAVEAWNKKRRPRQPESPRTACKASRRLVSHCASPRCGACCGGWSWPCGRRPAPSEVGPRGVVGTSPSPTRTMTSDARQWLRS